MMGAFVSTVLFMLLAAVGFYFAFSATFYDPAMLP